MSRDIQIFVHSTLSIASFVSQLSFLRVTHARLFLSRVTAQFPLSPRLCQSLSFPLSLSRPRNVLARGGHRVIGFIPEETGSRPGFGPVPRNPALREHGPAVDG